MPDNDQTSTARDDDLVIKNRARGAGDALPPGTLKPPFLGRQGDEQRQPSKEEARKIAETKTKLNRGEKV